MDHDFLNMVSPISNIRNMDPFHANSNVIIVENCVGFVAEVRIILHIVNMHVLGII